MANCVKIILVFLVTTRASLGVQETRHGGNFILTVVAKIQRLKRKEIVKVRGALASRQLQRCEIVQTYVIFKQLQVLL